MSDKQTEQERPFIAFYRKHQISPVAQDISDLEKHFQRRSALYRHLGLVPSLLRGKALAEFGPGSGHNAVFTASLEPRRYVLIDANPTGLTRAEQLLASHTPKTTELQFVESLMEEYATDERFDAVFCEGAIPHQNDPPYMLRCIARFVAPGGVLVTTCEDNVSVLSEMFRRLLGALLIKPDASIEDNLIPLRPVFEPHLRNLVARSRPVDDWIVDSVLHPFTGRLLSIEDAIGAVGQEFDVHGCSPKFFTDWTWYKSIHSNKTYFNDMAVHQYLENVHNLLDYRYCFPPRPIEENKALIEQCDAAVGLSRSYEFDKNRDTLPKLVEASHRLSGLVRSFSPDTADGIDDFGTGLDAYLKTGVIPPLEKFGRFWGRGQQYLSLIRARVL
jgi:ubiquinone/menaquinone biosynthesis C-methylase UbiE